jgi:hypothetical protein
MPITYAPKATFTATMTISTATMMKEFPTRRRVSPGLPGRVGRSVHDDDVLAYLRKRRILWRSKHPSERIASPLEQIVALECRGRVVSKMRGAATGWVARR